MTQLLANTKPAARTKAAKAFKTDTGLQVQVNKHLYNGLWYVIYSDDRRVYAGPFKTKKEAVERMETLTGEP